jgi:hypothetical protein
MNLYNITDQGMDPAMQRRVERPVFGNVHSLYSVTISIEFADESYIISSP